MTPDLKDELLSAYRVINHYRKREINALKEAAYEESSGFRSQIADLKTELRRLRRDYKNQSVHRVQDLRRIDELEQKLLEVVAPEDSKAV